MFPGLWWDRVVKFAGSITQLIKSSTPNNDPIGRLLVAAILFLVCAFFASLLSSILGRHLYDGIFAITFVSLICIVLITLTLAATSYGPEKYKRPARLAAVLFCLTTISWGLIDRYSLTEVPNRTRFDVEYLRLMLGATNLREFLEAVPHENGDQPADLNNAWMPGRAADPLVQSIKDVGAK